MSMTWFLTDIDLHQRRYGWFGKVLQPQAFYRFFDNYGCIKAIGNGCLPK